MHTEQEIREAIRSSKSKTEAIRKLGLSPNNARHYAKLNKAITDLNLDISHLWTEKWGRISSKLPQVLPSVSSYRELAIALGLGNKRAVNPRYVTRIKQMVVDQGLDISHFTQSNRYSGNTKRYTHEEIFRKDSVITLQTLKVRYLEQRQQPIECDISNCSVGATWNGNRLVLQLDHIDGQNNNNELDNLRLICPNCHSQTATFGGRRLKIEI